MADKIPKGFADGEKANSSKPPQWFTSGTTSFEKKNDERGEQQESFNQNIGQDIKDIKKDIQLMKNTPTMKRELNQE